MQPTWQSRLRSAASNRPIAPSRLVRHLPLGWCRSLHCRVRGHVSDNRLHQQSSDRPKVRHANDQSQSTADIRRRPLEGAHSPKPSHAISPRWSAPDECATSAVRSAELALPTRCCRPATRTECRKGDLGEAALPSGRVGASDTHVLCVTGPGQRNSRVARAVSRARARKPCTSAPAGAVAKSLGATPNSSRISRIRCDWS
jgi:hypothetical protein